MTRLISLFAALVLASSAVTASPIMPLLTGSSSASSFLGDPTASLTDPLDVASDLLSTSSPQVLPSGSVLVGSTTNVVPFTGIYPHLNYQPLFELNGPIVQDYTPFSPYFGNDIYGGYDLGSLGGSGLGLLKRQLGGSLFGAGPMGAVGGGGPLVGPTNNFAGAPSSIVTDTLIKPLVSITPHALEPVPYPVSTFYDYPVPVGVPAPVPTPFATGFGRGKFGCGGFGFGGFDDCGFDSFGFGFDGFGFGDFDIFDF
ncbi:hypothetical protein BG005_007767 [Podila minutissima]|nr:hypothetical protein BG005_007767 [Podila minutissima]